MIPIRSQLHALPSGISDAEAESARSRRYEAEFAGWCCAGLVVICVDDLTLPAALRDMVRKIGHHRYGPRRNAA